MMLKNKPVITFVGLAILAALVFGGCSTSHRMLSHAGHNEDAGDRTVKLGDVVEISFESYPEFDQRVIVQPDGTISVLALGEMKIADLPESAVQELLSKEYSEVLSDAKISVHIYQPQNFNIYIGGEIKKPGLIQFRGGLTIVQGILLAGGLADQSEEYEVVIFRNGGPEGVKMFKMEIKKNDAENRDFKLAPYDVVFVLKLSNENKAKRASRLI